MSSLSLHPAPALAATSSTASERRTPWILLSLFLASLLIRGAVGSALGFYTRLESDEQEYYNPAVSLSQGSGYRMVPQQSPDGIPRLTAYRVPGPSLIIALAFKILGSGLPVARWVSVFAGAMAAPLMYLFARQFTTLPVAILSAVACSLHPVWTYMAPAIASEPFFVPGLLLSLWLTVKAFQSRPRLALLAGLAWGVTALMRPHALPIVCLITLLALWRGRWALAAMLILGVAVAVVPWGVRNYLDFGRFYLLETASGETFLGSNNPRVLSDPALHGMWIPPMRVPEYRQRLANVHDDFERRDLQNAIGRQFLKDHPTSIPKLLVYKLWRWLTPLTGSAGAIRLMVLGSYGLLLLLLAIGVPLGVFKHSLPLDLVLICTFAFFVLTLVYWGNLTRGRMPLEIIWIPWAVSTLCALFSNRSGYSCNPQSA
jgi:4-amino-4-deoxy-L-arabinose transferase-like glycosyltransferase